MAGQESREFTGELRAARAEDLRAMVTRSPSIGLRLVESAARSGNHLAQMTYARMLLLGEGIPRDRDGAFHWFRVASLTGDPEALNMLGRCYEFGWGVTADSRLAATQYRAAARAGHAGAQFNLGQLLLSGDATPARQREGLGWHLVAARAGYAKSMNVVGRFCEEGWGMPQSAQNAMGWYRKAADAGDHWGQFNLGRLLADDGQTGEAARWFRTAAQSTNQDFVDSIEPVLASRPEPEFQAIATLIGERRKARAAFARQGGEARRREPGHRRNRFLRGRPVSLPAS